MRTALVIAIALAFSTPAAATWFTQGSYEPDNARDLLENSNPRSKAASATSKVVYFDVYPTEDFGVNPNGAGQVNGGHGNSPGTLHFNAVLGDWADCNGDNYVGAAEMALFAYPVSVLEAYEAVNGPSDCDASNGHIVGGWVHEMITIGRSTEDGVQQSAATVYSDARVWGDIGLPGVGAPGTFCVITPVPHGTTSSTGGAVQYADCIINHAIQDNVSKVDAAAGGLGLAWERGNFGCDDSPLNVVPPETVFGRNCDANGAGEAGFLQLDSAQDDTDGDKTDDKAAFYVVDCGGEPAANPSVSPTDSYADGVNQTWDATLDDCNAATENDFNKEWKTSVGLLDGQTASSNNAVAAGKKTADVLFMFNDGENTLTGVDEGAPDWAGLQFVNRAVNNPQETIFTPPVPVKNSPGYGWSAYTTYLSLPQTINRNTLQPSPRAYWTFYADVGAAALAAGFVTPASKVYGQEACQGATSGVVGGWNCDAQAWYAAVHDPSETTLIPVVGMAFQMRDYDCFDSEVAEGSNVRASLVDLHPAGPCDHIGPQ